MDFDEMISLSNLRKVKGIGDKTIERIREQILQSEEDKNYISEYNPDIHLDINEIHQGDCLELMNGIPDGSVDMILADLPYGTTKCKWDVIIPFDKLWERYDRIIKNNGVIVLFGTEPFSSQLRMSNIGNYKYDWIWDKVKPNGHLVAKYRPMQRVENIIVFSKNRHNYYPIMTPRDKPKKSKEYSRTEIMGGVSKGTHKILKDKYPQNIITISNASQKNKLHPTQKPIELLEYLINTYSIEGDTVLDNVIGSGSTAIAAINTNRKFIGVELDKEYFEIAKNRIENHRKDDV